MAKAKVSEIAKKLAAVKPDSIVLKNKEPRPVMMMNEIIERLQDMIQEKEVLGERLEAASAVLDQLVRICIEVEIGFQEKCRRKILIWTH